MSDTMDIRGQINTYLWEIVVKDKLIYDWGSSNRSVSRRIQHENCRIVTIDRRQRMHPEVILDFDTLVDLEPADMAFCIEVLEHARYPDIAIQNFYHNLKDGGELIITVPFVCPHHGAPDFWRFTHEGITELLSRNGFSVLELKEMSNKNELETRVGFLVRAVK